jgi:uncharacterized membrane protein YhaH (DUF805 family)
VNQHSRTVRPSVFFATTFMLSWAIWAPLVLVRLEVLPGFVPLTALTPVALLGVLMPAVAATFLTAHAAGRPGVRGLYSRLRQWRLGRWWLAVLLLQPAVLVITALVYNALARDDQVRVVPGLAVGTLLTTVVFIVAPAQVKRSGGVDWRFQRFRTGMARSPQVSSWRS